jgi:hypothetical protein
MPTIPVITAKTRPTAEAPSTTGGTTIDPSQNIATATAPLTSGLTKLYVKEKQQEANNKAIKILSDLYVNQEDGTKGLYSIQSETSANPNPSEASSGYDNDVEKLWNYARNTKLQGLDNFTKKALENKFYSTASLFKIKSLEGSRNSQIKETRNVTDDFVLKESLALKLNGIEYLEPYKNNILDVVEKNYLKEDEGIKKLDIQNYLKFGQSQLANDLAVKDPLFLKENINKFDALSAEDQMNILATADKQIFENKKTYFTDGMELTEDSTTQSIIDAYDQIKDATFGGDINKINLWQSLPENEKKEILDHAKTVRRSNTAELNNRNNAVLNESKQKSINDFQKMFNDSQSLETLTELEINNIFGEPKNDYELDAKNQIVELSTKIGQKEFSNVNNYYKNFDIQKAILSGQITDHITPFQLEGETEAKSITQRVGDGISKKEFGYYINYLLPNKNNQVFVDNHKKLYSVIEQLQPFVEGPSSLQYLDTTVDNRLNDFQSQMIFNFSEAIRNGENINEVLNINSKKFILKNLQQFKPNKDLLTKLISEKNVDSLDENILVPPQWNPDVHKSYEDYINSKEYQEYLIKKQEQ